MGLGSRLDDIKINTDTENNILPNTKKQEDDFQNTEKTNNDIENTSSKEKNRQKKRKDQGDRSDLFWKEGKSKAGVGAASYFFVWLGANHGEGNLFPWSLLPQ